MSERDNQPSNGRSRTDRRRLLEATAHSGSGAFATITHIQRLFTAGGAAPRKGCDAAHDGEVARVPYEATYAFYYPAAPAA